MMLAAFVLGVGAGVWFTEDVNLYPNNVASTELIDRRTPNSEVCMTNGYSAMVFDQRIFVSFNPCASAFLELCWWLLVFMVVAAICCVLPSCVAGPHCWAHFPCWSRPGFPDGNPLPLQCLFVTHCLHLQSILYMFLLMCPNLKLQFPSYC